MIGPKASLFGRLNAEPQLVRFAWPNLSVELALPQNIPSGKQT